MNWLTAKNDIPVLKAEIARIRERLEKTLG